MRIAIIGAGASGLAAVKCCLDEGLTPICFERTDGIGGLWRYRDGEVKDGQACVMKSTVINTSKETTCFSNFPRRRTLPTTCTTRWCSATFVSTSILRHVQFETEVTRLAQAADFQTNGRRDAKICDLKTGVIDTEVFDGVFVCSGHHSKKNWPEVNGAETFEGRLLHTHDYHNGRGIQDKRVVVVGIGNSGGDVAVELSRICSQVGFQLKVKTLCRLFQRSTWTRKTSVDANIRRDSVFEFLAVEIANYFDLSPLKRPWSNVYKQSKDNIELPIWWL